MMPLAMAKIGETVTIRKITGRDDVRQHLAELGFVMGERVTVVSKMGGNLICAVKDSRVALSQSMAMRVLVN
mgnify:CR=1 FL=1